MREYKFRGRRIDNGEWVFGSLIGTDVIVGTIVDWGDDYFNTEWWYKVDPGTVGPLTGLEDSNKQPLWEGDVVMDYMTGNHSEVVWDPTGCGYLFSSPDGQNGSVDIYEFEDMTAGTGFGVIGNIHDNPALIPTDGPELLKEGEGG